MSIYGETPSGVVDGTNTVFTTAHAYFTGSTRVFSDGVRKHLGVDYTESTASQITFTDAPADGTILLIDYDITADGANYPVGEWTFNPEGYPPGAALYNGPTLFPAGVNPAQTQTAVCVFGPGGAQVTVPPVFDGRAGQPALFDSVAASSLGVGETATAALTQVSPGGAGEPSHYTLSFGIPTGATGDVGANTLIDPQPADLEGDPAGGYYIGYDSETSKAKWRPVLIAPLYNITSISHTGDIAFPIRTLATLSIPAMAFPYTPLVFAHSVITGTANTQVDVVARLGGSPNTTGGSQISRGVGPPGSVIGTAPWNVAAQPDFGGNLSSNYAQVPANTAAIIYLNTEQQATTIDSYSTGDTALTLVIQGAPPT